MYSLDTTVSADHWIKYCILLFGSRLAHASKVSYPVCFGVDSLNTALLNTLHVFLFAWKGESNLPSEKLFMGNVRGYQGIRKSIEQASQRKRFLPKRCALLSFLCSFPFSPECCVPVWWHTLLFHHFPKVQWMPSKCQQQQAMLRSPHFGKTFMSFAGSGWFIWATLTKLPE